MKTGGLSRARLGLAVADLALESGGFKSITITRIIKLAWRRKKGGIEEGEFAFFFLLDRFSDNASYHIS